MTAGSAASAARCGVMDTFDIVHQKLIFTVDVVSYAKQPFELMAYGQVVPEVYRDWQPDQFPADGMGIPMIPMQEFSVRSLLRRREPREAKRILNDLTKRSADAWKAMSKLEISAEKRNAIIAKLDRYTSSTYRIENYEPHALLYDFASGVYQPRSCGKAYVRLVCIPLEERNLPIKDEIPRPPKMVGRPRPVRPATSGASVSSASSGSVKSKSSSRQSRQPAAQTRDRQTQITGSAPPIAKKSVRPNMARTASEVLRRHQQHQAAPQQSSGQRRRSSQSNNSR